MQGFQRLHQEALRSLGCDPSCFRIDLGPEPLREAIRSLAHYSFRLTIDLGSQAEVLGTFYQDVVTSTFRGSLGAYFTPRPIADLAVTMCEVRPDDTIFDISCGSGTFLTSAFRAACRDGPRAVGPQVFGCDIQERMVLTSTINCLLHGIPEPRISHGDGLKMELGGGRKDQRSLPREGFSLIVANPPFAGFELTAAGNGRPATGGRVHKIIPFIEKVVQLLAPGGRAALVIPTSVLNGEAEPFRKLRAGLTQSVQVTAIVNLPRHAFSHTDCGVAGALLFFRKDSVRQRNRSEKTFFARLDSVGYDRRGQPAPTSAPADLVALYRKRPQEAGNWIETARLYGLERWDVPWLEGCTKGLLDFGEAFISLTRLCEPVKRTFRCRSLSPQESYRYFEVADTNIDTGEILQTHQASSAEILGKVRLRLRVQKGDILLPNHHDSLVCKSSGGAGRSVVRVGPEHDGLITSNRFTALRPKIDPEVCIALLNSAKLREQLVLHARGSASLDIRDKVLAEVQIPRSVLTSVQTHDQIKQLTSALRDLRKRLEDTAGELREAAERLLG